MPAMHGIGWIGQEYVGDDPGGEPMFEAIADEVTFTRVNVTGSPLAATAVARVVGHRGGSASYQLTRGQLAEAITLLAAHEEADPADLAVWREMADLEGEPIYVFVEDPTGPGADPYVQRLIDIADSGRQDAAYGESRWWPAEFAAEDPYRLIAAWAAAWPDSLPLAHELKELFETRWVRFHSLPGSKRYPETQEEYDEMLERCNTVVGEMCAASGVAEILVIASDVCVTPAPTAEPDFTDLLPTETFWAAVPWHYADPALLFAHLYVSRHAWKPGLLDDLLCAIAEGDVAGVIVAPPDLRWLYHPYDGGADVILPTVAERDAMAVRHTDWRSPHRSGL